MAFKFPFTNYHELNLTWVLEQLKKLFEESEENVETIETYDTRLSAVESEVSTLETTTSQAINTANAAATNAATALSRANTANENALTAGSQAGAAVTAAQGALQEAQAATQAAQQAQATAMTFDGRITQAQNDASAAVHEAESFENRVNAAINTANNAANTATIAQGIAVNANQTAAQALDELNAQRNELVTISEEQQEAIEETAERVIASIPSDYTQLSEDVKNKAPLIVANASGEIAFFKDGADNMEIRQLLAVIKPLQPGTGEPSPINVRPISGWNGLNIARTGKNLFPMMLESLKSLNTGGTWNGNTYTRHGITYVVNLNNDGEISSITVNGTASATTEILLCANVTLKSNQTYILSGCPVNTLGISLQGRSGSPYDTGNGATFTTLSGDGVRIRIPSGAVINNLIFYPMIRLASIDDATYTPYKGQTTFSVLWSDTAGTVYGGTLNVITGKLTVNMAIVNITEFSATYFSENLYYPRFSNAAFYSDYLNGICNALKVVRNYNAFKATEGSFAIRNGYIMINVDGGKSTAQDAIASGNNLLSSIGGTLQVVTSIAAPVEYQLTPQELTTLFGNNTIYANCGPVSVDYPADTKLYIDGKFADLQALVLEN